MKSDSALYNAWHHRIAVFIACATLIVIIAGALVTSEDAGLSVPDWPTSYGHLIRFPPWVGGIVYEHSHRMIAWLTGFCTIVIAFWTWFVDRRRWMKALALGALGTIITQGILGGMTANILLYRGRDCSFYRTQMGGRTSAARRGPRTSQIIRIMSVFHLHSLCAARFGSHVPSSWHAMVAACGECAFRGTHSHLDGSSRASAIPSN